MEKGEIKLWLIIFMMGLCMFFMTFMYFIEELTITNNVLFGMIGFFYFNWLYERDKGE